MNEARIGRLTREALGLARQRNPVPLDSPRLIAIIMLVAFVLAFASIYGEA